MESFDKLCWPVLWTDQVLTEFYSFEILNADATEEMKICHGKIIICPLILSGKF